MNIKELIQEYISEIISKKNIDNKEDLIITIEEMSEMVIEYINQLVITNQD
jgi:hypothetical protein